MVDNRGLILGRICLVAIVLSLAHLTPVEAKPVRINFMGEVTEVSDPSGSLTAGVIPGATMSTSITYDPLASADTIAGPSVGLYYFLDPMTILIGDLTFDAPNTAATVIDNPESQADSLIFGPASFIVAPPFQDVLFEIELWDASTLALDSDALPPSFHLDDFPSRRQFVLQENIPGMRIEGEITSITFIPEPSAGLCLFGLVSLLPRRGLWRPAL